MILIISHPDDLHAQAVTGHLDALRQTVHVLDLSQFPLKSRMVLRYGEHASQLGWLDGCGAVIDLDAVGAVWWRRPQPLRFEPGLKAADFAAAECDEALAGLWQAMPAQWMNPPVPDEAAARKAWQLRLAGQLGLAPPETLICTCPDTARAFIDQTGDVIVKPFAGSVKYWRETRRVGPAERASLHQLRHAPAILQRRIAGTDIRVTVVGDQMFAARIDPAPGGYDDDFRMNHDVTITATDLPGAVATAIAALMQRLGLVYGALDFRRQPDGAWRFLEINPAGQFLFVEEQTRQPIARTIAAQLARMARRGEAARWREGLAAATALMGAARRNMAHGAAARA